MDALGKAPDVFAAHGYDAMWLTIQVMTIADPPETNNIRKAEQFAFGTGPGLCRALKSRRQQVLRTVAGGRGGLGRTVCAERRRDRINALVEFIQGGQAVKGHR